MYDSYSNFEWLNPRKIRIKPHVESLSEWCEVRRGRKKALGLRVQKTDDRRGLGAAAAEAADCLLVTDGTIYRCIICVYMH